MLLTGQHLPIAFECLGALLLLLGAGWNAHRGLVCLTLTLLVLTYADWRLGQWHALDRLPTVDAWVVGTFLVIEIVCLADFLIFLLLMSRTTDRRAAADAYENEWHQRPESDLPDVDVFITTYDEDWAILEKTIVGCLALDYPKKRIWVCDDGRRDWLKNVCEERGVGYITRPDNRHKKAGNNNNALRQTSAPFVASFDADFIPFPNFLMRTMGFLEDPRVGIVQTPQTFYNADPLQNNLLGQRALPGELRMFYETMQPARDAWDCAFYVGSCAVLRRSAIEAIGGIVEGYDTEDQVTTVALLRAGYITRFLGEPLSVGLAPETIGALIEQRKRWARGALQILYRLDGPLGLTMRPIQRLLFLQTFWWVGQVGPIVFACAPMVLWLFKIRLFPFADPAEALIMPMLCYTAVSGVLVWLSRGLWWPIMTPASQLFAAIRTAPSSIAALIKPFGTPLLPTRHVTPKGTLARVSGTDWRTLLPLLALIGGTVWGLFDSIVLGNSPVRHPYEIIAAYAWTAVLLGQVMLAALGCVERRYKRAEERFTVQEPASLVAHQGAAANVTILDLSLNGARVHSDAEIQAAPGEKFSLAKDGVGLLPCEVIRTMAGGHTVALRFVELDANMRSSLIHDLFLDPIQTREPDRFPVRYLLRSLWGRFMRAGP